MQRSCNPLCVRWKQWRPCNGSEPPSRIKVSRVGQQHIVRRKEEMRQQSLGSALSSADPMQVIAKIVSLIDTVRYRIWRRRLILIYIGFVGGFPGIVGRLQRSYQPLLKTRMNNRADCWVAFGSLPRSLVQIKPPQPRVLLLQ